MKTLRLSEINIYPIKSLGGISLNTAFVTDRGLQYDRRWMIVDYNGNFITQRNYPEMSLLNVSLSEHGLYVRHKVKKYDPLFIPFIPYEIVETEVNIWGDRCKALLVSNEADCWLSKALNITCQLVYMPENSLRRVDEQYAYSGEVVSFADAYPFLIIGQASLDDLNRRLELPVPMNRFRPNLVFTGGTAYEEDNWNRFKIGGIIFKRVKPCSRCVVTTINQQTGEKMKEPLATLAAYRKNENKVLFGQNLLHEATGILKLGDIIELLNDKKV